MRESNLRNGSEHQGSVAQDVLEAYVREGALRLLGAALEEEVSSFLGRTVMHGAKHSVRLRGQERVRSRPVNARWAWAPWRCGYPGWPRRSAEVVAQGFRSRIVERHERASQTTQRRFARLYLEGLATGDFEPVFREPVGETTAPSASTVVRLKEHWGAEYEPLPRRFLG